MFKKKKRKKNKLNTWKKNYIPDNIWWKEINRLCW